MEELQVEEFVYRVLGDEKLQKELESDPDGVIAREDVSPRVARVLRRLVPHLALSEPGTPDSWWNM